MVVHGNPGNKAVYRKHFRLLIGGLDPEVRRRESSTLAEALTRWTSARDFEVVLATLPLEDEPDLTPFLAAWLASGRLLALARTGSGRSLDFGYVDGLTGPWVVRRGGLREPQAAARRWEPGPRTLCLVPGLAFAPAAGRVVRLGRGGGYFDRWLSVHGPAVATLGIGFSVQETTFLPAEDHDQTLDAVLFPGKNGSLSV